VYQDFRKNRIKTRKKFYCSYNRLLKYKTSKAFTLFHNNFNAYKIKCFPIDRFGGFIIDYDDINVQIYRLQSTLLWSRVSATLNSKISGQI